MFVIVADSSEFVVSLSSKSNDVSYAIMRTGRVSLLLSAAGLGFSGQVLPIRCRSRFLASDSNNRDARPCSNVCYWISGVKRFSVGEFAVPTQSE